uniref:Uncharacterized protein n=1 Tax=Arundo donax TaxID=35708 RepID=A0A0A9DKQ5_ARUDO
MHVSCTRTSTGLVTKLAATIVFQGLQMAEWKSSKHQQVLYLNQLSPPFHL